MKKPTHNLIHSPKVIFFVSLTLYFLCQCTDLHIVSSGASLTEAALSSMIFSVIFPALLYWRFYRAALPHLHNPRTLPAMHCMATLFGSIHFSEFVTRLVNFTWELPLVWLSLFTVAHLLMFVGAFFVARHFFRLARGK